MSGPHRRFVPNGVKNGEKAACNDWDRQVKGTGQSSFDWHPSFFISSRKKEPQTVTQR